MDPARRGVPDDGPCILGAEYAYAAISAAPPQGSDAAFEGADATPGAYPSDPGADSAARTHDAPPRPGVRQASAKGGAAPARDAPPGAGVSGPGTAYPARAQE